MRKRYWRITTFGVIFIIFVLLWIFVIGISAGQKGSFYNKGHNAVWLEEVYSLTDDEIKNMLRDFKNYQIDTLFVPVGILEEDGTIDPSMYSSVVNFLEKAKSLNQNINLQAWIAVSEVGAKINLKNEEIRNNVAKQVMIFGQLIGFDGVHFGFGDRVSRDDFLKLLKSSRLILPKGKKLSISVDHFTDEQFYQDAMRYVDQFVVVSYESGLKSAWWYKWRVRELLTRLSRLLEDKEFYMAVSGWNGLDEVESIENSLNGVIYGLNNFRSREENFQGIAISQYFSMDEKKWRIYEKLWLE